MIGCREQPIILELKFPLWLVNARIFSSGDFKYILYSIKMNVILKNPNVSTFLKFFLEWIQKLLNYTSITLVRVIYFKCKSVNLCITWVAIEFNPYYFVKEYISEIALKYLKKILTKHCIYWINRHYQMKLSFSIKALEDPVSYSYE